MFPAITSNSPDRPLIRATISTTPRECPWAVSTTRTSAPAAISASARSRASGPTPTAAPTRRRPCGSFVACGNSIRFWMSLTVISPVSTPFASTTGSFSMRCLCSSRSASSRVVPTEAVTRPSEVITAETGCETSFSKRRSRLVRIPTRRPASSVIGTPDTW